VTWAACLLSISLIWDLPETSAQWKID